jgi:hypothetical protein
VLINAEFDADFESTEKVAKNAGKKVVNQNVREKCIYSTDLN